MQELVEAVLEDPRLADAVEFGDLVLLALRAGTWGPGAADVDAIDLEVAILVEIERRVDEAIAAGDTGALLNLGWLAVALGLESTADRITEALGGGS